MSAYDTDLPDAGTAGKLPLHPDARHLTTLEYSSSALANYKNIRGQRALPARPLNGPTINTPPRLTTGRARLFSQTLISPVHNSEDDSDEAFEAASGRRTGNNTLAPHQRRTTRRIVESEEDDSAEGSRSHYDGDAKPRAQSPIFVPEQKHFRKAHNIDGSEDENGDGNGDIMMTDIGITSQTEQPALTARDLKRQLEINGGNMSGKPMRRRRDVENDEENIIIVNFRVHQEMSWKGIVNYLNERREKRGLPPTMTDAAVYGRFTRNGPRVAAAQGWNLDPKMYMHLKFPNMEPQWSVKDPLQNAKTSNKRHPIPKGSAKIHWTPELERKLVESYQATQNKIWLHVRDEFEAQTGHCFEPEELSSHYHLL